MLGKTHLLFGIFLSTFFIEPIAWFIILLSSLLPDIDSKTSYLGRKVKSVGAVFEHRGFFHSFLFFIPATIIMYSFGNIYGLSFALGYGGHLLLDMMSKQGLRMFPFKYKIKGRIKVGGFLEKLFFFVILFLIIFRILI